VQIFMRLQTQWICDAMSGEPLRLDYQAARVVLELGGVVDPAEVFGRLQVMERGVTE